MNWGIIVLVMLAIIGSMMWMMPSPHQRLQAKLRQLAMRRGMQVQMCKLLFPRAIGQAAPEERYCTAYRLPRGKAPLCPHYAAWQAFRLPLHAVAGLPEHWGWGKGEGVLDDEQCALVREVIGQLPADVYALESTPVAVSLYWNERGTAEDVERILAALERLKDAGI